jgi:hypothetical protein
MDKHTLRSALGKWVAPLNKYVKKLNTLAYLLIFMDAQLNQHKALREIVTELESNEAFQKELGITSISYS